jgi:hypothetical protein
MASRVAPTVIFVELTIKFVAKKLLKILTFERTDGLLEECYLK